MKKQLILTPKLDTKLINGKQTVKVTAAIKQLFPDEGNQFMRIVRAMFIEHYGKGEGRVGHEDIEACADEFAKEAWKRMKSNNFSEPTNLRNKTKEKDVEIVKLKILMQEYERQLNITHEERDHYLWAVSKGLIT